MKALEFVCLFVLRIHGRRRKYTIWKERTRQLCRTFTWTIRNYFYNRCTLANSSHVEIINILSTKIYLYVGNFRALLDILRWIWSLPVCCRRPSVIATGTLWSEEDRERATHSWPWEEADGSGYILTRTRVCSRAYWLSQQRRFWSEIVFCTASKER